MFLKKFKKNKSRNFQSFYRGHSIRNNLISDQVCVDNLWMLDIGTNNGALAEYFTKLGHYVIGVDVDEAALKLAKTRLGYASNIALMHANVDEMFFENLPRFDVIFMLSVFHRIWASSGPTFAKKILKEAAQRTDVLFFEGAIRHKRYFSSDRPERRPEFTDMDVVDCIDWHLKLFRSLFNEQSTILHLGNSPCTEKEPFRPLFMIKSPTCIKRV